jgi:ribosomal protein L12E/L44/L45/RPP1/RPP2
MPSLLSLQILANKQRQLLHTVQQQCQAAGLQPLFAPKRSTTSTSSSSSLQPDYAWALSMVKSRTFGQKLPQLVAQAATAAGAAAPAAAPWAAAAAAPSAAAAAAQELEDDDSGVVLLMAPYIDMINHAPDNNCIFGIDPDDRR